MLGDRLEVVLVHVPTNVPPELRAFLAGVAKVEASQGPRQIHVLDRVVSHNSIFVFRCVLFIMNLRL